MVVEVSLGRAAHRGSSAWRDLCKSYSIREKRLSCITLGRFARVDRESARRPLYNAFAPLLVRRPAMGLSTHVLDTVRGRPAHGMTIELYRLDASRRLLKQGRTNDDGRIDGGLIDAADLLCGRYELVFAVA